MDIVEKMEQAARMPTPPAQWCAEAVTEIRRLRRQVKDLEEEVQDALRGGMTFEEAQR